jgi:acetyl esterase/lipase
VISWLLFTLGLLGAAFTYNAWRPSRRWHLVVLSFLASLFTSELAMFHVLWLVGAAALLVTFGGLAAWPGWLGLAIVLASCAGLIALQGVSVRAALVIEKALHDGLGEAYRERIAPGLATRLAKGLTWSSVLLPFYLRDRRVERVKNIPYVDGGGRRNQLDVYRPRGGVEKAPVLLQIHGGAWVMGDKAFQALPLMMHLASNGWICVAANYRLSPRAVFPDHLVDCKRALAWIRAHIAEYGGDPDFVVVTGGSAGGHLASLVALTPGDPRYQPGFEDADTRVAACVAFYGVYDLLEIFEKSAAPRGFGERFERGLMGTTVRHGRAAFEDASPLSHVSADAPPFFIVHGTADNLVPVAQARRFAERLRAAARKPVVYVELAGASHAFEVFHSVRTGYIVNGVDRFLAWLYSAHLTVDRDAPLDPMA